MSTSVGTLQPKVHVGTPFLAAIAFALLAAATIGIYVSTDAGTDRSTTTTTISGTAANTPTELRGGILQAPVVRPVGRSAVTPRVATIVTAVNTPSELGTVISFGTTTFPIVRGKQLGTDVIAGIAPAAGVELIAARNAMLGSYQQPENDDIIVNGEVCQICWKYR